MDGEDLTLVLDIKSALELYLFLKEGEEGLPDSILALFERSRDFLYERLSIEELEMPDELLARLDRAR